MPFKSPEVFIYLSDFKMILVLYDNSLNAYVYVDVMLFILLEFIDQNFTLLHLADKSYITTGLVNRDNSKSIMYHI